MSVTEKGTHMTPVKLVVQRETPMKLPLLLSIILFGDAFSGMWLCISAAYRQDKLSVALERVQLQTEEATLFQSQTNDKILLIKVGLSRFCE